MQVNFIGVDIFTGKKYEDCCPSSHKLEVPHIRRVEMILVNIDSEGFITLMTDCGELRSDLRLPDKV